MVILEWVAVEMFSWFHVAVGKHVFVEFPCNLFSCKSFSGNILLNIMLTSSVPLVKQGKNNISMVCVPNPPVDPKAENQKPVPMLIRVKTSEDADELLSKMNELKK